MLPMDTGGIAAEMAALQTLMAGLLPLVDGSDAGPARLKRMDAALRELRTGVMRLTVQLQQAKAAGRGADLAAVLTPSVATALAELGAALPRLAAEMKARRTRLAALMQVTRQRAQEPQGYRPLRGGRMALVQRQVRHCVQISA
ncbi:hypothetical protein [Oleisolibacter albus]|uniref:hypothetical protein n=1 Tax=Oleisolibacter albus TaxID=2171757 RepID=UPI000DF3D790|nr:hypothetical protein [Oleisolibacter albus]